MRLEAAGKREDERARIEKQMFFQRKERKAVLA